MGVVNLSKNQVVNLSKSAEGLKQVVVGLGWDEAKESSERRVYLEESLVLLVLGLHSQLIVMHLQ